MSSVGIIDEFKRQLESGIQPDITHLRCAALLADVTQHGDGDDDIPPGRTLLDDSRIDAFDFEAGYCIILLTLELTLESIDIRVND